MPSISSNGDSMDYTFGGRGGGENMCQIVNSNSNTEQSSSNLIESTSKFLEAVNYMKDTVMLPSRLKDIPSVSPPKESVPDIGQESPQNPPYQSSLYSTFLLLTEITKELNVLPNQTSSNGAIGCNNFGPQDDYARKASLEFREQLKAVLESLEKLTNSAYYLAKKYQENIGDQSEYIPQARRKGSLKPLF